MAELHRIGNYHIHLDVNGWRAIFRASEATKIAEALSILANNKEVQSVNTETMGCFGEGIGVVRSEEQEIKKVETGNQSRISYLFEAITVQISDALDHMDVMTLPNQNQSDIAKHRVLAESKMRNVKAMFKELGDLVGKGENDATC